MDQTYDLELFQTLNAEYDQAPVLAKPPGYTPKTLEEQASARIAALDARLDISGKRLLEFGCGRGYLSSAIAAEYDCDVVAVDIQEYDSWPELQRPGLQMSVRDLTLGEFDDLGTFDRVASFTVLEHVRRPYEALDAIQTLLRPGGRAYISTNLYRGPLASHRYHQVKFPWPHLLFEDDVFEEFYASIGREPVGAEWVNKLTAEQYVERIRTVGLQVDSMWYDTTPIDEEFLKRFEDKLGRYPRQDLERDFMHFTLTKPVDAATQVASAGEAEARLAAIEQSTSWRLTAPLRAAGDQVPALRARWKQLRG